MRYIFHATIFTGSFLLFFVQPMLAKKMLPALGGSPAVWTTSMAFYQTLLLAGYAYAHAIAGIKRARTAAALHGLVALGAASLLPLALRSPDIAPENAPVIWLLLTLAATAGAPFFVLAANAPLIQRCYHRAGGGKDPYFLYSLSNAGSLLSLAAYPFILEPHTGLRAQFAGWSALYAVFTVLLLLSLFLTARSPKPAEPAAEPLAGAETESAANTRGAPAKKDILFWLWMSALPSALLQSITFFISSDIGSLPLLWIVPLALYLITHIIAFAGFKRDFTRIPIFPPVILLICTASFVSKTPYVLLLHLAVFFLLCLTCHARLSAARPAPRYLTAFYMALAFGGMAGGVTASVIIPYLFDTRSEYWLFLLLILVSRKIVKTREKDAEAQRASPRIYAVSPYIHTFIAGGAAIVLYYLSRDADSEDMRNGLYVACIFLTLFSAVLYEKRGDTGARAAVFAFAALTLIFISGNTVFRSIAANETLFEKRTFFGYNAVTASEKNNARYLLHGNTLHGLQPAEGVFGANGEYDGLFSYYHYLPELKKRLPAELKQAPYAVLGLGAGTLACFAEPGQKADIFEIDQAVIDIAKDSRLFSFLRDCRGKYNIIAGDGRLEIAKMPDKRYGVLLLDAYSSDSMPVHLFTREALTLYADKLRDDGVILINVSSRYLDAYRVLHPVLRSAGFVSYKERFPPPENERGLYKLSEWVIAARDEKLLKRLQESGDAEKRTTEPPVSVLWTDDYSALLPIIK